LKNLSIFNGIPASCTPINPKECILEIAERNCCNNNCSLGKGIIFSNVIKKNKFFYQIKFPFTIFPSLNYLNTQLTNCIALSIKIPVNSPVSLFLPISPPSTVGGTFTSLSNIFLFTNKACPSIRDKEIEYSLINGSQSKSFYLFPKNKLYIFN
jgi:hypothetical protein